VVNANKMHFLFGKFTVIMVSYNLI